jgi:hypothetical protein
MVNNNYNHEEEVFMLNQQERYEQRIKEIQDQLGCSRGKARRIIESQSRKIIEKYNKSVLANQNKPKIDVSDIVVESN